MGAVIAAMFAYGRGRDESDAVIVPGTGSTSETTSETTVDTAADTTAVITTPETDPSTTDTMAGSIQAIVHEDFSYYGACGNEVVDVFGSMFYPLLPEQVARLDLSIYPLFSPARMSSGLARPQVGPPGPGDDIGTMTVYSDGVARFESRSGIVIWLSDREQSYYWVC